MGLAARLIEALVYQPDENIIDLARQFGGKLTKMGSDSHVIRFASSSDMVDFWDEAQIWGLYVERVDPYTVRVKRSRI